MPKDHRGKKFGTLHKFGSRKRRRRQQSIAAKSQESELQPSTSKQADEEELQVVTSERKIRMFQAQKRKLEEDSDGDETIETGHVPKSADPEPQQGQKEPVIGMNLIVNLVCLQSLIVSCLCPECKNQILRIVEGGESFQTRVACLLEVICESCGSIKTQMMSEKTGFLHTGYDINRQLVTAATANGISFTQLCRVFAMMNMPPPMSMTTWYFYKKRLQAGATRAATKHLQVAAQIVRDAYSDLNLETPDQDGVLNISVSVDGSWQKRVRNSHNGIVAAVEVITGVILDYVPLSNNCATCKSGPAEDDPQHAQWMAEHKSKCQKNTNCSSGAMEQEGASILFSRSVDLHGFRYVKMLGDGDAKTHARLLQDAPYGDDTPIEKIECVNHVTKRMGTALRNLVQKMKSKKESISGRGRLTEERIKKLTNYYGRAIKDNSGDLEAMERAVWASFFHSTSSEEDPHHTFCPPGPQSWCFFQRALAAGSDPPSPPTKPLPPAIKDALVPVYQRLGDPQLLSRCLAGKTQNSNESLHSLLWRTCPKERWANLSTVDTALAMAVQRYNKGSSALVDIMVELELSATTFTTEFVEKSDTERVQHATRKTSEREKQRRKRIETVTRRERQEREEREGVVYGAGQF